MVMFFCCWSFIGLHSEYFGKYIQFYEDERYLRTWDNQIVVSFYALIYYIHSSLKLIGSHFFEVLNHLTT